MYITAIGGGNRTPSMYHAAKRLETPDIVVVPSACSTLKSYDQKVGPAVRSFQEYGLRPQVLHGFGETPSPDKIAGLLGEASLIYTLGGSTPHLMRLVDEHGTSEALRDAATRGVTLAGASAGAVLPFEQGQTQPVAKPREKVWDYELINGLAIAKATIAVHADTHDPTPEGQHPDSRREAFARMLPEGALGIALDNGVALVVEDNQCSIIKDHGDELKGLHFLAHVDGEVQSRRIDDPEELTELLQPAFA